MTFDIVLPFSTTKFTSAFIIIPPASGLAIGFMCAMYKYSRYRLEPVKRMAPASHPFLVPHRRIAGMARKSWIKHGKPDIINFMQTEHAEKVEAIFTYSTDFGVIMLACFIAFIVWSYKKML